MSRLDREDIRKAANASARVAKADVEARKAELLADFEAQLAAEYEFDDARWAAITEGAQRAVAAADEEVRRICAEVGIPERFRPQIAGPTWYRRGENAAKERRAELRKVATTRLDAQAKKAKVEIDRENDRFQAAILAATLTNTQAQEWMARLPTAEALLHPLELRAIEQETKTRDDLLEERVRTFGP
jgi:hypothetical protein